MVHAVNKYYNQLRRFNENSFMMGQTYADLPDLCAAHEPPSNVGGNRSLTALRVHRMLSVLNLRAQATVQSEQQCGSVVWLSGSPAMAEVEVAEHRGIVAERDGVVGVRHPMQRG